jgi:hypothetical protein
MALIMLALAAAGTVALEAFPAQQKVLVGEPIGVTLVWRAQEPVEVFLGSQYGDYVYFKFTVDDGSGPKRFREKNLLGRAEYVQGPTPLQPGKEVFDGVSLLFGQYGDDPQAPGTFIFPRAGRYTLRISYSDGETGPIEANPVSVTVEEPTGDDAEVFRLLAGDPFEIAYGGPRARSLLANHPRSPYLWNARMDTFNERDNRLANHRDPRTDEELWHLSQSEWDARARGELRAMADELVSSDDFGPLEEARLARAADYYRRSGDTQAAERREIEILERFPRSFSAQRIRERSDKTPPTLAVTAAPDSLWPPNHKLVPITVAVQVSDDRDPNPMMKLESITCDDGCDPTKDVADAMVNTDDRQFQLRAERSGTGTGRTYTITYSARDISGNITTKMATVTVPHDQRQ